MTDAASPGTASISAKIATDTASSVTTMRESLTIRNLAIYIRRGVPYGRLAYFYEV
ncbi:MAG: hypothetical protein J4G14_11340 [Dehalococcoidia bacterium]|nr:hypothetical protein [Dehalococcoidia bacterium]